MKVNVRELLEGLVSENTLASYELSWAVYVKFAGNTEKALDAAVLTRWRQELAAGTASAATINIRLAGVKTVFRELYNHKKISREVYWESREVKPLPRTALKERRRPNNRVRIEPEQMRALCTSPVVTEDTPTTLRDRALLMTLATTGARISEVIAMRVRDVYSPSKGKYAVANVVGKNHSEPRDVPLSPEAHNAIMDWVEFRPVKSPYIFSSFSYSMSSGDINYSDTPMGRGVAAARVKHYGRQLGIPHIKPHDFRRFVGTQLAKINIRTAQKVLGHASIETTVNNYVMDDFSPGVTDSLF